MPFGRILPSVGALIGGGSFSVRRWFALAGVLMLIGLLAVSDAGRPFRARANSLPGQIGDVDFWQLMNDLSEPGGSFIADNFVSNERTFQRVIPELQRSAPRAGAYLGVGPDQNFTYIATLEPQIAFIIDIRRQNLLLHLMHKALIELSADRVEFLSRLFSRPRPAGLSPAVPAKQLVDAFAAAVPDSVLFERGSRELLRHLIGDHGFPLSSADQDAIRVIHRAFFDAGPELRYAYPHRWFPTFSDLMLETDDRGVLHGYLAREEIFQRLKRLHRTNRIVPVVGDFAGGKTIREVGRYLRAHGAAVSVFYTSNVEFYLFEQTKWNAFVMNVASLPIDRDSRLIRAYFDADSRAAATRPWGAHSTTEIELISETLRAYEDGRIRSYFELTHRPGTSPIGLR
jgi:hypothetical protein